MISSVAADLPKWWRINALLREALGLPNEQREPWLERIPPEHRDLLPLLRSMLARAAVESDAFMRRPVDALWPPALEDGAATEAAGQHIGPYRFARWSRRSRDLAFASTTSGTRRRQTWQERRRFRIPRANRFLRHLGQACFLLGISLRLSDFGQPSIELDAIF
jgi:hypothetical protein